MSARPNLGRFVTRHRATDAVVEFAAEVGGDTAWMMVVDDFDAYPDDVAAWRQDFSGHAAYPLRVLALHALGRPIPEPEGDE